MTLSKKLLGVACVAVIGLAGCKSGGGEAGGTKTGGETGGTTAAAPKGPMGNLVATVKFTGTAPKMDKLKREADPFCAKTEMTDETVLVKDGMLQNVMVRVKGTSAPAPAGAAMPHIDQVDCMYRPRVVGLVAGQTLEIKNSDETGHNVHTYKGDETIFNRAQPQPGSFKKESKELTEPNGPVTFKCDIHPWMTGYAVVNSNPWFAVTGEDGLAKIELPVGKHTVEAWHEKYGVKSQEVTVEEGKPLEITFEYDGTETGA